MAVRTSYESKFCGSNVKWSPFEPHKVVLSQAQHFGIVGNGAVSVLMIDDNGILQPCNEYVTQDACYDSAFNEGNENQIITAGGDGSLRLWDFMHE